MRINAPPYPGAMPQNTAQVVAAHQVASAGFQLSVTNLFADGATIYFNYESPAAATSNTVALKIRSVDPVAGGFIKIGQIPPSGALSASGMQVVQISPFLNSASAAGFACIPSMLPRDINFLVSLSSGNAAKKITFSLGVHWNIT